MTSPFTYDESQYTRHYTLFQEWEEIQASFLAKRTGKSYEGCLAYVRRNLKNFPLVDPRIRHTIRPTPGNRTVQEDSLSHYFQHSVDTGKILSPSLTVYHPPSVQRSYLSEYQKSNIARRKGPKKLMMEAKARKDHFGMVYYDNIQTDYKYNNNTVSGGHKSPGNPLFNPSAHTTLTATCRCATGYGNASNEKFLQGNRHYWSPDVVEANIMALIRHTDQSFFAQIMDRYHLVYPSVEDTMNCIEYSTQYYWKNEKRLSSIRQLVETLTPLERALFVYIGDFYHLYQHNPQFVSDLIHAFAETPETPVLEGHDYLAQLSTDQYALVMLLCSDIVAGRVVNELKEKDQHAYGLVNACAKRHLEVLEEKRDIIEGLLRPAILAPSVYSFPSIMRRAVLTSDTDSSIATTQYWMQTLYPGQEFSRGGKNVWYVMSYLTSQLIIHQLAMYTANLGVEGKQIGALVMKNEYAFPAYSLTPSSKHYYAYVSAREGVVYDEFELEIKGAQFKSPNAPKEVMRSLRDTMRYILDTAIAGGTIDPQEYLRRPSSIEHSISQDLAKGGFKYLRTIQIKPAAAYKMGEMNANFQSYVLWEEVWAPKYGTAGEPPYMACKLNVDFGPRALRDWIATMKDRTLATRLERYLHRINRKDLTTLYLPQSALETHGLPEELKSGQGERTLISGITSPFYLLTQSLGLTVHNGRNSRMFMDLAPPQELAISGEEKPFRVLDLDDDVESSET